MATDSSSEEAKLYEAIGMMFAQGSGLGKMGFTDKQVDLILAGMKKESHWVMPPSSKLCNPRFSDYDGKDATGQASRTGWANSKVNSEQFLALEWALLKDPVVFTMRYYERAKAIALVKGHYHGMTVPFSTVRSTGELHRGDQGILGWLDQD